MANPEHVKVVRRGAAAILQWRRENPSVPLDLTGADLREADLDRANLNGANLSGARLTNAALAEAKLRAANLMQADLSGAIMRKADLTAANLFAALLVDADLTGSNLVMVNFLGGDLTRTKLTRSDLSSASFSSAILSATSFAGSRFRFTSLGNCDLSRSKGLSTVKHRGPSSIGVDTLITSLRRVSTRRRKDLEVFLLSAGVPRDLLARPTKIAGAAQYPSCFISYGKPDLDLATRLHDDLGRRGVFSWLYDLDATPGERTWKEISRQRGQSDRMVVICSAKALIRDGVLKEIEEQIDEDPDKMIPISRDDVWMQPGFRVMRGSRDLGPWLRDRNYADFSDDSRYEASLERLLKALRRKAD
jgi:hypothetical protein